MPTELPFCQSDSRRRSASAPGAGHRSPLIARWCAEQGWPDHLLPPCRQPPEANCAAPRVPGHSVKQRPRPKSERWRHGFHAATTTNLRYIHHGWGTYPEPGVGTDCDPAKLVVIDGDAHPTLPAGCGRQLPGIPTGFYGSAPPTVAVLEALRDQTSPAEDTGTQRMCTPSGGPHVWHPLHGLSPLAVLCQLQPSARLLPLRPGQELKRAGHLPTPRHAAPRLVPPRARQAVIAVDGVPKQVRRALSLLLAAVEACSQVCKGAGFSHTLNRATYTLGGLVNSCSLIKEAAQRVLYRTAITARSGQERRVEQLIRSGLAAGVQHLLPLGRRP